MHKIHVLTKIYENKIENEIKNSSFFVCMFSTFPANSNKKPKQKKLPKKQVLLYGPHKGQGVWKRTRCYCDRSDKM